MAVDDFCPLPLILTYTENYERATTRVYHRRKEGLPYLCSGGACYRRATGCRSIH